MTVNQLVQELRRAYRDAKISGNGEVAETIILFGIKYADELRDVNLKYLVEMATEKGSYTLELRYGIRLAKYVQLNEAGERIARGYTLRDLLSAQQRAPQALNTHN